MAIGLIVAAPLILVISGGQVEVPQGTQASAKVASDVMIEILP